VDWPRLRTFLFCMLALSTIAFSSRVLDAQTDDSPGTTNSDLTALLKTIDQLVEQNRRLQEQNGQLIEQINVLRKTLAAKLTTSAGANPSGSGTIKAAMMGAAPVALPPSSGTVPQAAPGGQTPPARPGPPALPGNPEEGAGGQPARALQDTAATPANADDKSLLPQASSGLPTIFGEFNPGRGFVVGRGRYGELDFSGYMAARFLDQMPGHQTATDHLGRPIAVTPRLDFQFHRVMLFSQGWLFDPKFQFLTFVWTVQDTNQVAVGGALSYNFNKYINLGLGWNAYPGTQSLQGSHPYWESYDRVMADEFFRPYFSQGVFAQGNLLRTLQYRWMVGNNLSNLDVPAIKLNRDLSGGFAITWFPTTGEFGPRGAFGDYEWHERLATRFNFAYTFSPEDRQTPIGSAPGNTTGTESEKTTGDLAENTTGTVSASENTTIRLADGLNVFDTGALANGVTVQKLHYQLFTSAAGIKYHGFWLQGEGYYRKLDHFEADGPLPVSVVRNTGFYVQAAQMIVPRRFELYAATSYIFGQFGRHPHEFLGGFNYYPWNTRNLRLNVQLINVSHSPVSSTFGFYMGQITGPVFSLGFTALY
jgi:hypothetical protein